jgi:hypothetical protein
VHFVAAAPSGPVEPLVAQALSRVASEKGRLLVYAGATWCEPCQLFHRAAERGELDGTFPGLTLLEFDMDRDAERLASAGYTARYIPLFALPGQGGRASGKKVEGGIKGDGAVGYIVPRVAKLLEEGAP